MDRWIMNRKMKGKWEILGKNVSFLRIMEITLLTRHQWLIHKPDHHAYSHLQQGIINPPPPSFTHYFNYNY